MTTQQDPYSQQVRHFAEMIARDVLGDIWERQSAESNEYRISKRMPIARAMVAEMAKQYEHAYFSNYPGDEDSPEYELWNQNCIAEMQERGLIPSPNKTGE